MRAQIVDTAQGTKIIGWVEVRTHELTRDEFDALPEGTELHWTNMPGRASQLVTKLTRMEIALKGGNVKFANGAQLTAMSDELTRIPRIGLES